MIYIIIIVYNPTSVMSSTVFICSSRTLCHGTYSNIMIKILTYATAHHCPELKGIFTGDGNPDTKPWNHSLIHHILFKGNPKEILSQNGIHNVSNIIIGPEVTHEDLIYKQANNFSSNDKLILSKGAVSIVDRRTINTGVVLGDAIKSGCSLLIISLLLAILAAVVLWYAVSLFCISYLIH